MSDSRDVIQARLLTNINDSYNKSEGEFIYDIEKPVAMELENVYKEIELLHDKAMPDTAKGKDLEKIVKTVGLSRKATTKSYGYVTVTGTNGSKIVKGDLFASDSLTFVALEDIKITNNEANLLVECTNYGSIGNIPKNAIKYIPKTLSGIHAVINNSEFTNGYDEESDDDLRKRYYIKVQTIVNSANKNAYRNWALEVTGVGDANVIPLWEGPGTVKVIIINSNKVGADEELVENVQSHIDPNKNGDGEGAAPCGGGICTVVSATEKNIDIGVKLITTLNSDIAKAAIENAVKDYLKEIAFSETIKYASYAMVGKLIISIDGIDDYTDLTLNSGTVNIDIESEEVAVLGGVTLG
ncbi:putative phage protein gp47/JayE [Clostridium beijerinckii]|uniref:baseplate J/gp47 family protein n=1 Tax=Clostridium beijerinckii TaxID=1520 RepID=UPI0014949726|nr:baseplate J/gp47 family protein [Clostridium beijerinckii]NOW85915.1 putative phage protein gp47/JayE [Clostridium beijerinckii]